MHSNVPQLVKELSHDIWIYRNVWIYHNVFASVRLWTAVRTLTAIVYHIQSSGTEKGVRGPL